MSPRKIKNLAISYIAEQLEKNPDWFYYITDSWIYDAESWFLDILKKKGMKIFTNDTDFEYTEEVETVVRKFWGYVQKEKDRRYEELYGESDAFSALPGMIRYIKKVQEGFDFAKKYYIQDSPTREGHCNHVLKLLQQAIYEMEDLRIKSKEKK
jgi:hypothetical protein